MEDASVRSKWEQVKADEGGRWRDPLEGDLEKDSFVIGVRIGHEGLFFLFFLFFLIVARRVVAGFWMFWNITWRYGCWIVRKEREAEEGEIERLGEVVRGAMTTTEED